MRRRRRCARPTPNNPALQACCNLARIAVAGDDKPDRHAYFANDREQLRSDISGILGQQFPTTSRTQAAFSGVGAASSSNAPAASYRFFSQFAPMNLQTWGRVPDARALDLRQTTAAEPRAAVRRAG